MNSQFFATRGLRVSIEQDGPDAGYHLGIVQVRAAQGWETIATGMAGHEFQTSDAARNAGTMKAHKTQEGSWEISLTGSSPSWTATSRIVLSARDGSLRRTQTYRFIGPSEAAIIAPLALPARDDLRYTFPLRAYDRPPAQVAAARADATWALPLPFHIWHTAGWVAIYGVDRHVSSGTLDYAPPADGHLAQVSVWYPDSAPQPRDMNAQIYQLPASPGKAHFAGNQSVSLTQVLAALPLRGGEDALLEGTRRAAKLLLAPPRLPGNVRGVCDRIAAFYPRSSLWKPDALGKGRGWFNNMWVYTQAQATQSGAGAGFYDLGWGEGNADETILAIVRHWKRTGQTGLLPYVNEMTRNIALFSRNGNGEAPFYDRKGPGGFGDFLGHDLIWSQSLGHIGRQLLRAYQESEGYPDTATRGEWLRVARSISGYFAAHQQPDGDISDVFDHQNRNVNQTGHRIAARAVVCGLWAGMAHVTGDRKYLERALRLAHAVSPQIQGCEFSSQMIDAQTAPCEITDGESTYYVLEGLVPLYESTKDPSVLALCRRAAAVAFTWTYYYDLPNAYRRIARGGQVCRMPDFPLLFPGGTAKGVEPLMRLSADTGDPLYGDMAREMIAFIGAYQIDRPGSPLDGGMVHAYEQDSGEFWGPNKQGQVDAGMSTGNSLSALEYWLAHAPTRRARTMAPSARLRLFSASAPSPPGPVLIRRNTWNTPTLPCAASR